MKKIIAVFLTLCFILLPAGCKKGEESSSEEPEKKSAAAANAGKDAVSKIKSSSSRPVTSVLQKSIEGLDNTKQGWGQGRQVDKDNRPISCVQFQEKYGKYGAVFIGENTKKVYLTFDEGYENGYTPKILDTLKQEKVHAVFFVTHDYAKRNADLVKRIISEGHTVGNHSYTHPSMPSLSFSKASDEIKNMHEYVKDNFNCTMTLFRPPMGEFSERTLALAQSLGYRSIFWSFAYADWDTKKQIGAEKAYQKIIGGLHNGAIYLLHAVSKDNAEILGRFIEETRKQGYEFAELS